MSKEKNNRTYPEGAAFNGGHWTYGCRIHFGMARSAGRAGKRAQYPRDCLSDGDGQRILKVF